VQLPSSDDFGKIGRMALPQWYDTNMDPVRLELIRPDCHRRPLSPVFTAAVIHLPACKGAYSDYQKQPNVISSVGSGPLAARPQKTLPK
jgi:hypothetical protein